VGGFLESSGASKRGSDHKRLIDAVEYRQSFKYMSARNWRKGGEPYEPEFKRSGVTIHGTQFSGDENRAQGGTTL